MIAGPADAAREAQTAALLDDVGSLVGGDVEARGTAEGDTVAVGVGRRSHGGASLRRRAAHVGPNVGDVVFGTEGALDGGEVR